MNVYVFDTGVWVILFRHYPEATFSGLWKSFNLMVAEGRILSSSEVLRELKSFEDFVYKQASGIDHVFSKPSIEELKIIKDLANKYKYLVSGRNINNGSPVADCHVLALARAKNGIVVTTERFKPNSQKMPNICNELGIGCLDLNKFFEQEKWEFPLGG
ncbi:MAG: DUF4411 family protein [Candidatus Omnitrophica bacterium]|nr:DUF4411 family protein [Candidatus Omnitrophota bacterium]